MPLLTIGHAQYWRRASGADPAVTSRQAHYPAWQSAVVVTAISLLLAAYVVTYGL